MSIENTPMLETKRLILRRITENDVGALFAIMGDREVNTFLPWFPLKTMEEARAFYEKRYAAEYEKPAGYRYGICLKEDNTPIGYVNVSMDESHDLGYGLRKEFWRRGIMTEAASRVIQQVREDGLPYITATHDRKNPRSGDVMIRLGMIYRYSYEEQWQPKDIRVVFRMYQLNLDGKQDRVFQKYWEESSVRYIEG